MPDRAIDGWLILHLLGVGGIVTAAIWLGYGVIWLAMRIVEWSERG